MKQIDERHHEAAAECARAATRLPWTHGPAGNRGRAAARTATIASGHGSVRLPWQRFCLALVLLSGCTVVDRIAGLAGRTANRLAGIEAAAPARDPLFLHLQLAMLSDSVVGQLVQQTEAPLLAAREPGQRETLLRLRLDYASALWNAASGPNPYANAIDMLVTLSVGQRVLDEPPMQAALGPAAPAVREVLASAETATEGVVRSFLDPAEYQALRDAIAARSGSGLDGATLASIDLEPLLGAVSAAAAPGRESTSLFRLLGVDPFAGLDPATREIAESRQFGERLLFSLQRLPFLMRLNAELLSNDVARDLGLERVVASLERASLAMGQVARTAAALPDQLDQQRLKWIADLRGESDRLGPLARDTRGLLEAATTTAATTDQALQTFSGVLDRLRPAAGEAASSGRPFDVTEYSHAAAGISEAAIQLSALLGHVEGTLDSPGLARWTPQLAAVVDDADLRGRRLLHTAFALACALIVLTSVAVLVTASLLRRSRARGGPGRPGPAPDENAA